MKSEGGFLKILKGKRTWKLIRKEERERVIGNCRIVYRVRQCNINLYLICFFHHFAWIISTSTYRVLYGFDFQLHVSWPRLDVFKYVESHFVRIFPYNYNLITVHFLSTNLDVCRVNLIWMWVGWWVLKKWLITLYTML